MFISTAVGIRCKDGVVFGVEKLVLSKLYEEGANKRIFNIDRHVGMVRTLRMLFRQVLKTCPVTYHLYLILIKFSKIFEVSLTLF